MANSGQIFASFAPAVGSTTTFSLEIMEPGYAFFFKQKYGEKLNNTWMITFYIGILAIFGNFGQIFASFTPPVASQVAFLPEIIVGRYSPLR